MIKFTTDFDHHLGEVAYRHARYEAAVDKADAAGVDVGDELDEVVVAIDNLIEDLERLRHRILGKL